MWYWLSRMLKNGRVAGTISCSRNARPQNDAKEQADGSSCSQSPTIKRWSLVRAVKNNLPTPSGKLGNQKVLVACAQLGSSHPALSSK
jgi:hypothetical protein